MHPILSEKQIQGILNNVYGNIVNTQSSSPPERQRNIYRLNMILAIGSVDMYRGGRWPHRPFGYFTAALQALVLRGFSFTSVDDLVDLLFIARFGLLFYTGTLDHILHAETESRSRMLNMGNLSDLHPDLYRTQDAPSNVLRARKPGRGAYTTDNLLGLLSARPTNVSLVAEAIRHRR